MKKRVLSIALCLILALSLLPAAALAENYEITSAAATITAPVPGAKADFNPTYTLDPETLSQNVDSILVSWNGISEEEYQKAMADPYYRPKFINMNSTDVFEEGYYYTVNIHIFFSSGYSYSLSGNATGTINGISLDGTNGDMYLEGDNFTLVRYFDLLTAQTETTDGEVAPNVFPVTPAEETEEPVTDVDEGTDEEEVVEDVEEEVIDEAEPEVDEVEEVEEEEPAPKTGDASTGLWVALLIGMGALAAAGVRMKKRA